MKHGKSMRKRQAMLCAMVSSTLLLGIVEMAYYLGNVRKIGFDLLRAQGRGVNIKATSA